MDTCCLTLCQCSQIGQHKHAGHAMQGAYSNSCPIMLIRKGTSRKRPQACGWSLVIPAHWVSPFWQALIYRYGTVADLLGFVRLSQGLCAIVLVWQGLPGSPAKPPALQLVPCHLSPLGQLFLASHAIQVWDCRIPYRVLWLCQGACLGMLSSKGSFRETPSALCSALVSPAH